MPEEPEDLEEAAELEESGASLDEGAGVGDDQPLFGRFDAATLLSVEGANGGEWASLGQVLVTFKLLFGELPEADGFAESCGLLCDAGLVEYTGDGLDLLGSGRKLLRRAGRHGSAERPARVAELLGQFDEGDLGEEGAVDTPSGDDVAAALGGLTEDVSRELSSVHAENQARRLGSPSMVPTGWSSSSYGTLPDLEDAPEMDDAAWPEDLDEGEDPEEGWSPDLE